MKGLTGATFAHSENAGFQNTELHCFALIVRLSSKYITINLDIHVSRICVRISHHMFKIVHKVKLC